MCEENAVEIIATGYLSNSLFQGVLKGISQIQNGSCNQGPAAHELQSLSLDPKLLPAVRLIPVISIISCTVRHLQGKGTG